MTAEALGNLLAPVNAGLNLTSTVCLLVGFAYIRKEKTRLHRRAMLGAVAASGLFLVLYVLRFSLTGTHRFAGEGLPKLAYLAILFSHMVLAVVILPLVLRLLYLAFTSRFEAHRRLARWTFPIWLYVSVSGLLVYLLLYHVYGYV
jgi:putative membrane protein